MIWYDVRWCRIIWHHIILYVTIWFYGRKHLNIIWYLSRKFEYNLISLIFLFLLDSSRSLSSEEASDYKSCGVQRGEFIECSIIELYPIKLITVDTFYYWLLVHHSYSSMAENELLKTPRPFSERGNFKHDKSEISFDICRLSFDTILFLWFLFHDMITRLYDMIWCKMMSYHMTSYNIICDDMILREETFKHHLISVKEVWIQFNFLDFFVLIRFFSKLIIWGGFWLQVLWSSKRWIYRMFNNRTIPYQTHYSRHLLLLIISSS